MQLRHLECNPRVCLPSPKAIWSFLRQFVHRCRPRLFGGDGGLCDPTAAAKGFWRGPTALRVERFRPKAIATAVRSTLRSYGPLRRRADDAEDEGWDADDKSPLAVVRCCAGGDWLDRTGYSTRVFRRSSNPWAGHKSFSPDNHRRNLYYKHGIITLEQGVLMCVRFEKDC